MTDAATFGVVLPEPTAKPAESRAAEFGVTLPTPAPPAGEGAFFGAAHLLPEGVQKWLPDFLKGPSVGEQLTASYERRAAEEKRLGRPLTPKELEQVNPIMSSPVAVGFATHQVGELGDAVAASNTAAAESFIKRAYTRAAKPGVSGKQTAAQLDRYHERARDAISSIVENKPNLRFTDPAGQTTVGELPKSLEQFAEAIDQTKQSIFQKYDAMAKTTGQIGIHVDLSGIVSELQKIANDQVAAAFFPDVTKYAESMADSLSKLKSLSPSDAQNAIQGMNASLKAFYRAPSFDIANRAGVAAMIANRLRSELDQSVEYAVGPGYQDLKNQYGALKTIEKDVVNRAQVVARQEAGGGLFGRLADVASAAEVLEALTTLNPTPLVKGAAMKGWAEFVKRQRDPNRAVMKLFETAEGQQYPTPSRPIVPSIPISPIVPAQEPQNQANSAMGLR